MNKEKQEESVVRVNSDPAVGPLDGAEATVNIVKTKFSKNGKIGQRKLRGEIRASYDLGVVSVSLPGENLMLSVRIDEMMQVMYTSAEANKEQTKANSKRRVKNDRES